MPTCTGHCFYMIFPDDYIRYIFVCLLPDDKSKTCTSAYHSDIKGKARLINQDTVIEYKRTTHPEISNSTYNYANNKVYFNIHSPPNLHIALSPPYLLLREMKG